MQYEHRLERRVFQRPHVTLRRRPRPSTANDAVNPAMCLFDCLAKRIQGRLPESEVDVVLEVALLFDEGFEHFSLIGYFIPRIGIGPANCGIERTPLHLLFSIDL